MDITWRHKGPWPAWVLSSLIAIYWTLAFNQPLWSWLSHSRGEGGVFGWFSLAMFLLLVSAFQLLLSLVALPGLFKPITALVTIAASSVAFFMHSYHIVVDINMVRNVFETDHREALSLFHPMLVVWVLLLGVLPAWLMMKVPVAWGRGKTMILRYLGRVGASLAVLAMVLGMGYQDFSSLFRNHKEIRFYATPTNFVYYTVRYLQGTEDASRPVKPVAGQIALGSSWRADSNPVLVFIAGETARFDAFELNGYARPTNPELKTIDDLRNFGLMISCGTDTAHSLPCMFSFKGREQFDVSEARFEENVLDVFHRLGLTVLWRDNSTGCKHLCDRVSLETREDFGDKEHCSVTGCFDEVLLNGLDKTLAKATKGAVVVLHTIGSHGPAYHERYPASHERFRPVCQTNQLQDCDRQAIRNAYDNTIVYTDHFIASVIAHLQSNYPERPVAVLYVSDHGESLGENGLYLHGLPYFMAPDEQKQVPFFLWYSEAFAAWRGLNDHCWNNVPSPLTHDYLSHTLLGLLDIQADVMRKEWNLLANCQTTTAHP
jgi:lipid A ethanolaminephosphotransferase